MKGKKQQLFQGDSEASQDESVHEEVGQQRFGINEEFAKKFEHNKRRELLQQAKEQGKDLENSESSSSSDDSDASMLNEKVEKKFRETLQKIKKNDPSLKNMTEDLFKDEDFDKDNESEQEKPTKKKMTYKDTLMMASDEEVEYKRNSKETHVEEQDRLKSEFMSVL